MFEFKLNLKHYDYTVKCEDPYIIVIHNFMSDAEIRALLNAAGDKYIRSQVGIVGRVSDCRTSTSATLASKDTSVLAQPHIRVAKLTGVDKKHHEEFDIVKYEKGQHFEPHYDWYNDSDADSAHEMKIGGQRCITILVCLEEPKLGGATNFPYIPLAIQPVKGDAVLWINTNKEGKGEIMTLHEGQEVKEGTKIVMNSWIRTKEQFWPKSSLIFK